VDLQLYSITFSAGYVPALKSLSQYIGILDVLTAFSVVAAASASSYVRPKILDKGGGRRTIAVFRITFPIV
jgi:DNA mismatch repair ATPase MutS